MEILNYAKLVMHKLLNLLGYLLLVLIDSVFAMIVAPKLWPGLEGFHEELFGVIPINAMTIGFAIGFSLSAIQRVLMKNTVRRLMRREQRSFFENKMEAIKFYGALVVALLDSFLIDAQFGLSLDPTWWGWVWFTFFGLFSLFGEFFAEYIWEKEFTPDALQRDLFPATSNAS